MQNDFIYECIKKIRKYNKYENIELSEGWIDCYEVYTIGDILDNISLHINDYFCILNNTLLKYNLNTKLSKSDLVDIIKNSFKILEDAIKEYT